jgi:hypothetical protein
MQVLAVAAAVLLSRIVKTIFQPQREKERERERRGERGICL